MKRGVDALVLWNIEWGWACWPWETETVVGMANADGAPRETISRQPRLEGSRTQMQLPLTLEKVSEGSGGAIVHFKRQMYLKWLLWSGSMAYQVRALAVQVWLLEFNPWNPCKDRRKAVPRSCPLTSTYMSWHHYPPPPSRSLSHAYMHALSHSLSLLIYF